MTIENILGSPGRIISGSKSMYRQANPNNQVIFNANVCTKEDGKIWFGDLDLTLESEKLYKLSAELKKKIYVLREHDGRFYYENSPALERAVAEYFRE